MIRLESLTFNNIRCFDSEQTVSFTGRDKLIQVDGRNENTGGSSGAGKTTVFLALDYLLGINDIPATVLQSRLTKDAIAVSGQFDIDGKPAKISRSKKNGLSITYNGETVSGNVKMAEEKLDELLGIPRKLFRKMAHKRQKEGGFFLDMTAKETYEFLVNMLGLNEYIKKAESINESIKEYAIKINDIKNQIVTEESGIGDLSKVVSDKIKPQCNVGIGDLEMLELEITKFEYQATELKNQQSTEIETIKKPEKIESAFDATNLERFQNQLLHIKDKLDRAETGKQDLEVKLSTIATTKEQVKSIAQRINDLKEEKNKIEHEAVCPTCTREWTGELAKQKLASIQETINVYTDKVLGYKDQLSMEAEYVNQLDRLKDIIAKTSKQKDSAIGSISQENMKKENHQKTLDDGYKAMLGEYNIEIAKIKSKFEQPIADVQKQLDSINSQHKQWSYEMSSYEKNLNQYNEEMSKIAQSIDAKKALIAELQSTEKELVKKSTIASESQRLIKTYVLQTFQDTLDLIGDTATEILSAIPNMSSSTIYFEGCKENKSGGLKDEVTAIINMDGNNKIPIKSLSGGERTAIDLAVDLAVIDIIESKTGKGADFFVIDEPFDGLDSVCKEECLEILKQVDTNKKIIMVDHSSELKEMVSDIITVVKNGESSSILQ